MIKPKGMYFQAFLRTLGNGRRDVWVCRHRGFTVSDYPHIAVYASGLKVAESIATRYFLARMSGLKGGK